MVKKRTIYEDGVRFFLKVSILLVSPFVVHHSTAQELPDSADPVHRMLKKLKYKNSKQAYVRSFHTIIDVRPGNIFHYQCEVTDVDSEILTYKLISGPKGAVIGKQSGLLLWHPSSTDIGSHTFRVQIEDNLGGLDQKIITVNVDKKANTRPYAVAKFFPPAMQTLRFASGDVGTEARMDKGEPWLPAIGLTRHPLWGNLNNEQWVTIPGWGENTVASFRRLFSVPDNAIPVSLAIEYFVDNAGTVFINGKQFSMQRQAEIFENFQAPVSVVTVGATAFKAGINELRIDGRNFGSSSGLVFSGKVKYLSAPMLDGSGSYDTDGDKLTYFWRVIDSTGKKLKPIAHSLSPFSIFKETRLNKYQIELTVNDGRFNDVVTIMVSDKNVAPIAHAQVSRKKGSSTVYELNADESFDVEGKPLSYHWRMIVGPSGTNINIDNAGGVLAAVKPKIAGLYAFELVVDDGALSSSPVQVFFDSSDLIK